MEEHFGIEVVEKDFDGAVEAGQFNVVITKIGGDVVWDYHGDPEADDFLDAWREDGVVHFSFDFKEPGDYQIEVTRNDVAGNVMVAKDGTKGYAVGIFPISEPMVKRFAIPVSISVTPD